jgi:uncharacterized membrane protein
MKTLIAIVMSSCLMLVLGCASSQGGSVGSGQAFKIVVPVFATTIKQGETTSVTVSLDRGDAFKRDVTLDIQASTGISVEPTQAVIKASDKPEVALRITAGKDAALGTYQISVKGTPETGEATSTEVKVKVVSP